MIPDDTKARKAALRAFHKTYTTPNGPLFGAIDAYLTARGQDLEIARLKAELTVTKAENAGMRGVCSDIVAIMDEYARQEAENGYVDTPGGLEHMGDVWKRLENWAHKLRSLGPDPIAAAVAEERERCAKIADDEDGEISWSGTDLGVAGRQSACRQIARLIRAGGQHGALVAAFLAK